MSIDLTPKIIEEYTKLFKVGQWVFAPRIRRIGQIIGVDLYEVDNTYMPVVDFQHLHPKRSAVPIHLDNCTILDEIEERLYRLFYDRI